MVRRYYESLNYLDGQPSLFNFRFSRSGGSETGVLAENSACVLVPRETSMTRAQVRNLRDMLNDILEDWQ